MMTADGGGEGEAGPTCSYDAEVNAKKNIYGVVKDTVRL